MSDYEIDRKWSDRFLPQIKQIVGPLLIYPADFDRDAHEATDLIILTARDLRIAARVRRYGYANRYPWQFTIRAQRDNQTETELSKIVNGWGDWFFYGHANESELHIDRWLVISLDAFRAALIRDVHNNKHHIQFGNKSNNDGTHFKWFNILSFPDLTTLIISSSHQVPSE